jgi:hypothetical protein
MQHHMVPLGFHVLNLLCFETIQPHPAHVTFCFQVVHDVPLLSPSHSISKRSIEDQLNIHLVYDYSISQLAEKKQSLIKVERCPLTIIFLHILSRILG